MEPLAVEHYPLSLSKTSVALARQIGISTQIGEHLFKTAGRNNWVAKYLENHTSNQQRQIFTPVQDASRSIASPNSKTTHDRLQLLIDIYKIL
jgi:hypothetical protein